MERTFTASVSREGKWYVAQCVEVDIASQGESEAQAVSNLAEALKLHFSDPVATAAPTVTSFKIDIDAA